MVADFAQHFENPVPDPVDCINPLSDPTTQIDSELSGLETITCSKVTNIRRVFRTLSNI